MENTNSISNKTILNNNSSVGTNCLSFIQDNVRYKIYNKFWHSLEVKSTKAQVGTNTYNWINNKEERLREHIPKTLDNCFTRLEFTFYRKDSTIPSRNEIDTALEYLHEYMDSNIMFNTPIAEQWRAYTENIKKQCPISRSRCKHCHIMLFYE